MAEVPTPVGAPDVGGSGQGASSQVAAVGESGQVDSSRLAAAAPPEELPRYLRHTAKRKGAPAGAAAEAGKRRKAKKGSATRSVVGGPATKPVVADVILPTLNQELVTSTIDAGAVTDAPLAGVDPSNPHGEDFSSDFHRDSHEKSSPIYGDDIIPPPSSSTGGGVLLLPPPGVGSIWERAVIPDEVRRFLDPPRRFSDLAPLGDADLADLRRLEVESIRAASLVLKYSQLQLDASRLATELSSSLEVRRKAEEELRLSVQACAKANADFAKASSSLLEANADLERTRTELQKAQGDLKTAQDALSLSQANLLKAQGDSEILRADLVKAQGDLGTARTDLEKAEGDLKLSVSSLSSLRGDYDVLLQKKSSVDEKLIQASGKIEELEADLTTSVKDAFSSCLKQIRFLNPTVDLNLDGVHHNAYVYNNQFVRAEPEVSVSAFEEEDDEEEEEENRQPGV